MCRICCRCYIYVTAPLLVAPVVPVAKHNASPVRCNVRRRSQANLYNSKETPEKLASYNSQMQVSKGATKGVYILTSVTKKAWNPYGTLLGSSTTATGSADIVFASITFTSDFLHPRKHIHLLLNREIRSKRHMLQVFHE